MDETYLIPDHILALAKTAEPPGEPFGWAEHDDHTVIVMRDGRKLTFPNKGKDAYDALKAATADREAKEQASKEAKDDLEAWGRAAKAKAKTTEDEAEAARKVEADAKKEVAQNDKAQKRFEINMEDGVDEQEGSAAGKALRARKKEAKK